MPDTPIVVPNATADVGGKSGWFTTAGLMLINWDEINNGILTPQDTEYCMTLANDAWWDCWFDWTGLPVFTSLVRRLMVGFRYAGFQISQYPDVNLYVYTDYPTPLARLIDTVLLDFDSGGVIQNKTYILTGLDITRDELLDLRFRYESVASGGGGGGGKLPSPYEEPNN